MKIDNVNIKCDHYHETDFIVPGVINEVEVIIFETHH